MFVGSGFKSVFICLNKPVLLNLFKSEPEFNALSMAEYQQLFTDFYKPIRNFIYFKCSNADMAEDIAQDVFLKLWETRSRIDKRTVKAYLYTIAQNLTINQLKR